MSPSVGGQIETGFFRSHRPGSGAGPVSSGSGSGSRVCVGLGVSLAGRRVTRRLFNPSCWQRVPLLISTTSKRCPFYGFWKSEPQARRSFPCGGKDCSFPWPQGSSTETVRWMGGRCLLRGSRGRESASLCNHGKT